MPEAIEAFAVLSLVLRQCLLHLLDNDIDNDMLTMYLRFTMAVTSVMRYLLTA